jgi:hypothetical protein
MADPSALTITNKWSLIVGVAELELQKAIQMVYYEGYTLKG